MNKKEYRGLDIFRWIACLMVIAIHTSPLSRLSAITQPLPDFILTRIICRVAVPFFFMTTGFFLVQQKEIHWNKVKNIIKKLFILYLFAILLYLPINIYTDYFTSLSIITFIQDILLNGTFYHLWYLPASIIGILIVYLLYTYAKNKKQILFIVISLYIIGLFGNSYYYLIAKVPVLKAIIDGIGNTRNGILFAPMFLYLGVLIAIRNKPLTRKKSITNASISFLLLTIEALLLHHFKLQKFDSLYIFLIPTMYYLFNYLLTFKGKGLPFIRNATTIVYIIHPFVLIILRFIAKKVTIFTYIIEYGFLQFISVSLISFGVAYLYYLLFQSKPKHRTNQKTRAWLEIDIDNLKHNLQIIRGVLAKNSQIMAVVKADAYGHGAVKIAKALNAMGVYDFAVATINEAIELRNNKIRGEILILGYTHPDDFIYLKQYNLTQTIFSLEYAKKLKTYPQTKVHIKIDTGMNRLGVNCQDSSNIIKIYQLDYLKIEGTYSHLAVSDSLKEQDIDFTNNQIKRFNEVLYLIRKYGFNPKRTHLQSTYGVFNYPHLNYDYVRIGIGLFGVLSDVRRDTTLTSSRHLKPILALKARVALVKVVATNENISYGNRYKTEKPSLIATITIGYGDGYPRCLSNTSQNVIINGYLAPIVGRICMDQLLVDISNVPASIQEGDIVTLIGKDRKEEITIEELAMKSNTITNEFLTGFNKRLPLLYPTNKS